MRQELICLAQSYAQELMVYNLAVPNPHDDSANAMVDVMKNVTARGDL